jgi:hypothetical protein
MIELTCFAIPAARPCLAGPTSLTPIEREAA